MKPKDLLLIIISVSLFFILMEMGEIVSKQFREMRTEQNLEYLNKKD